LTKERKKLHHYAFILRFSKPHLFAVVIFFFSTIFYSGIVATFAWLLNTLVKVLPKSASSISSVVDTQVLEQSYQLLYLGIPAAIGLFIFHGTNIFIRKYLALRISLDLRKQLCRHTMGLSLRFFDRTSSGDILSRSTNDVLKIEKAFEMFWGEFFHPAICLLIYIPATFYYSWEIALMSLVVVPVIIHLVRKASKKILSASREGLTHLGEMTETLREIIDTIKIIKVFRLEDPSRDKFYSDVSNFFKATLRAISTFAFNSGLMEGITYMMIVVLGFLSCYLTINNIIDLSLSLLVPVFFLLSETYKKIKAFSKSFNAIQESFAGIDRVEEILEEQSEIIDSEDAIEISGITTGVSFENVVFGYSQEPVLKGINFSVESGQTVALVGKSGSGKTTAFNLIARFYDVNSGKITFDGVDVRDIKQNSLLSQIAIVTQEPILFNDTIFNNIRFGRLEATEEEVREAARNANVLDFAMEFPEGMKHNVGERGSNLSGGQRQRVTIARAMLKNPPLLLLDEATSALDSESELAVQKALEVLMKGRTTIVIAHRLSTIRNADKIVVIEQGNVVEIGTHNLLLAAGNTYADLCRMQETGQTP